VGQHKFNQKEIQLKILIIDGSYLAFKSYFAFSKNPLTATIDGEQIVTSTVFGFINEILSLSTKLKYDYIINVHDSPPYKKKNLYPSYKEGRKSSIPSFNHEKELIKAITYDLNIPNIYSPGYEGEEVAKAVIKKSKDNEINFFTNDEDCFALLSKNVSLITTIRGDIKITTQNDLMDKYNVTPKQFRSFKAITGCSTDNVKGVNGIGPVGASQLISEFGSIKEILKNLNDLPQKIQEKFNSAMKSGQLKSSIILTRLETPKHLKAYKPEIHLPYADILEFIEARSFLKGSNKLILKHIQAKQKENQWEIK
jgi:DNA polymerase-1